MSQQVRGEKITKLLTPPSVDRKINNGRPLNGNSVLAEVNNKIVSESCSLSVEHSAQDWKVVVFDPCPMPNGSGVKSMPGSISAPNSGSF